MSFDFNNNQTILVQTAPPTVLQQQLFSFLIFSQLRKRNIFREIFLKWRYCTETESAIAVVSEYTTLAMSIGIKAYVTNCNSMAL